MQIRFGSSDIDLKICQTAQTIGDRWLVNTHHARIRIERNIRLKLIRVLTEERFKIFRSDLFLTFKQELEIDGKFSGALHQGFNSGECSDHLSLHIGRTAPVEQVTLNAWLKRTGVPQFERIGWLDIIVSIN